MSDWGGGGAYMYGWQIGMVLQRASDARITPPERYDKQRAGRRSSKNSGSKHL